MTEQQLKLNLIARTFGTALMKSGIKMIRSGYEDYEIINSSLRLANDALDKIGLKISVNALDISYYYTTWENWQTIIDVLYGIIKDFKWEAEKFDCKVPNELAWTYGLFFADGSCGIIKKPKYGKYGGAFWRIVNANKSYLEKAKSALDWEYKDFIVFKINEYKSYKKGIKTNFGERKKNLYCLNAYLKNKKIRYNSDGTRGKFIEEWYKLFYDPLTGLKQIPKPLYDIYTEPQKYFIEGLLAGDGVQNWKSQTPYISLNIKNRFALRGLDWFLFALNWKYRIKKFIKEFRIYISRKSLKNNPIPNVIACDNRSNLMTSLCSLLFRINTCAGLYCKVLNLQTGIKYLHWANIIFTKDGKVYLFDVDNFGKYQQIISSDIIMGQNKYTPISIKIY